MINKLSCISNDSKLGKNITIDAFSTIHENVEIGDNCWIGSNVTILPGARIGNNCKIFPGSVISGDPQALKFKNEDTLTIIRDNTIIREFVTINKGTANLLVNLFQKSFIVPVMLVLHYYEMV